MRRALARDDRRAVTIYLTHLLTTLVEATKTTFDGTYPEPDFRGVHVSMEYPIKPQDYPSIWVDYEDTQQLQIAGVKHRELTPITDGLRPFTRWRFGGYASFTVVALTSLECARLYDEMVRVMAFGQNTDAPQVSEFRQYIESNEFIACNFDFDQIQPRGTAAAPGTPWGTDEIIYERSINMEVIGEFVSNGSTQVLVPLSAVVFDALGPDDADIPDVPGAIDPYAWQ